MRKKKLKANNIYRRIVFWVAVMAWFIIVIVLFFTSTRTGLRLVTKKFLPDFISAEDIVVGNVSGQLSDELIFDQIELKDLKWFPSGTVIRIQRLMIKLKSLNPQDAQVDFENIRLFMPYSDPIVFSGHYHGGQLSANVYSSNISIEEILSFFPQKINGNPNGVIKNLDLYLEGPLSAVNVKGTFMINELVMPMFSISQAPGDLALVFRLVGRDYFPSGQLRVTAGKVKTKNATLKLAESKLLFSDSFTNPVFHIKGNAAISKVDIEVMLLGTSQQPQWQFSSNPPMAQEVLMIMFLTGKNMDVVQTSVDKQRLTPDLAKDLADYFLLGGEGGRLAQKLGIKDVSIIYDKDVAGIGVKKEVTDFLDIGYQVEQKSFDHEQNSQLKHTLGAELKLNSRISVEVDKEVSQFHNQQQLNEPLKSDDRIFLKYKTRF